MEKEEILVCPHCGNKTGHELLCRFRGHDDTHPRQLHPPDEPEIIVNDVLEFEVYYELLQCKTCKEPTLFYDHEAAGRIICFPDEKLVEDCVPDQIKRKYTEAKRIQSTSPRASVVLLRSALESLCHDKKARGGNLRKRIEDLGNRGIIPTTLATMAYTIKEFGDLGAHADDEKTTLEDARAAEDFFSALVEYVYVAPAKLDKISKRLKGNTRRT